jgi:LysM repeat protein
MRPRPAPFALFGPAALAALLGACKGPDAPQPTSAIAVPDQAMLAVQWQDGPRRHNAEVEAQRNAREVALRLFPDKPMGPSREGVPTAGAKADDGEGAASDRPLAPIERPEPSWVNGADKPAAAAALEFPRSFTVEVRRGETAELLAEWARTDARRIISDNANQLARRNWVRIGDRVQVVMSPNQKVLFDRKREAFQRERIEAYFSNRYFAKVIVYRARKGETLAEAAKRFGDTPMWLIEEFNQNDFRNLQPGDEVLIPVVASYTRGQQPPSGLTVVDENGRPLGGDRQAQLGAKLSGEFRNQARMALDDGSVFSRPRPGALGLDGTRSGGAAPGDAPLDAATAAGAYPRPTPPAMIGAPLAGAHDSDAPLVSAPGAGAAAGSPAVGDKRLRDVVVKRGESLGLYAQWAQTSIEAIKAANPHLDPDRIFVGARMSVPMTDAQLTRFVITRASWESERGGGGGAEAAAAGGTSGARRFTVRSGDSATAIARQFKVRITALRDANKGIDLSRLRPGQKLVIPAP